MFAVTGWAERYPGIAEGRGEGLAHVIVPGYIPCCRDRQKEHTYLDFFWVGGDSNKYNWIFVHLNLFYGSMQ